MFSPEENLKSIVEEIQKNEIMLPDFQRQFDWDIEKQRGLVASVLTKLPVGGILLLKAQSIEYKSKQIGLDSKEGLVGEIPDKTYFLLDGQQRMTCLTNVFSDIIHKTSSFKVSKLASRPLLATRFYLRIDRWDADMGSQKDLFGIRSFDFGFDVSKGLEPDFLTEDVIDYIECRPFLASEYGNKPYMPEKPYDDKLDEYCFETQGVYLIPLFLFVGSDSRDDKLRTRRLLAIIKKIQDGIKESMYTYYMNLAPSEQDEFAFTILRELSERDDYLKASDKDAEFSRIIDYKADVWNNYFRNYLGSCVEKLKLNKIEMPEGSRARAIDIYENMNMGGMSLNTLDLVAARVAKVSQEPLYDRILKYLSSNKIYCDKAFPSVINGLVAKDYNASKSIRAIDVRVSKACSDLFLELLGLYSKNKDYNPNNAKSVYSKSAQILKLSGNEIDDNCKKVCIGIDRAFCFLQVRCGVQNLADINYKLMIRLISYIFTNDEWYNRPDVHNKLEAWYWAAIFSGEYDKDQNERYEKNLKSMIESLTISPNNYDWINSLKNNVLETLYFSDCSYLLMEKASEDRFPKEHLGKYFCQFYLSKPYTDLITDDRLVHVFTKDLEKHHIIPLGSVKKIEESTIMLRENKTNIANSPLNFVYITSKSNSDISSKSLGEYQKSITATAKSALSIVNFPSTNDYDEETIRVWLRERHELIKGQILSRISELMR